jgi:FkbM family methyltransferase
MQKVPSFLARDPRQFGGCVYYAQNREDLVLASFFPDVEKGFYVDVGGYDPDYDSVTKLFYLQGWKGINIEPQPSGYEKFQKERKRDKNLNIGISNKSGELKLRTYTSGGLSTFSENVKQQYEARPDNDTREFKEITVPVRQLKEVFVENDVKHIDFMKVDVEGYEYELLESNDWKQYRPEVLCIEANHIEHDWRPLLHEVNYELVFNDNLNDYYVDKATNRRAKFDFVKDVINDRGGGIRADIFEQLTALYSYALDKTNHVDKLAAYASDLEKQLQEANKQLREYDSIKHTTKHLNRLVSRNVTKHVKRG